MICDKLGLGDRLGPYPQAAPPVRRSLQLRTLLLYYALLWLTPRSPILPLPRHAPGPKDTCPTRVRAHVVVALVAVFSSSLEAKISKMLRLRLNF